MLAVSAFTGLSNLTFGQGQVTGTISGIVQDPSGAVIPGATVTALNTATNFKKQALSSDEGYYRLDLLPVGVYEVSAEVPGFKKALTGGVRLGVNDFLKVDFKLETGEVTETVTVVSKQTEVNTESSTLGRTVTNLADLPLLSGPGGRNPLLLATTQPGVVAGGQVGPFSVNGQRAQANNYMLDGGDSNDLAINVPDALTGFSPDALQEFKILTSAYAAEYGRNSGSIVNVLSKSGANKFHGNLFEFFRNRVLNATPFFNNSAPTFVGLRNPQFNVNEFGGTIGGPIVRDKTFLFFSYLGFRRRQGVSQSATVPTDAQRDLINQFGTPLAKTVLTLIPRASTGNTLFSSPSNSLDRNQFFIKGDHNFTERNRFFVSAFTEKQVAADPFAFGGGTIPGFGTTGDLRFTNIVLNDTHAFGPRTVNEARFSFHRRGTLSVVPVNRTKISGLGINGIVPDDPNAEGPPNFQIAGFTQFGNTIQGPQGRYDNTFQYSDNFSLSRSRHYLKFGFDIRTYAQNQVFDFINNGLYVINGGVSSAVGKPNIPGLPAALVDFANGVTTAFIQNSAGRKGYRTQSYNLFLQDDFKVKPYFTLNMGLRYELNTNLVDLRDQVAGFRAGQKSTVFPTAPRGLVFPGDTGVSRSTYGNDYNNFAPRFGFAWDVLRNGKMSLRGGYGLFYDIVISETTLQFLTSAPYAIQPAVLFTTFNNPYPNSAVNPLPQPFPFKPAKPGDPFDFTTIAPVGLTVMDPNFRTPYANQFHLGLQYELQGYTLEAGYVGSTGVKLLTRRQINPAIVTSNANSGNVNLRRILNQNNPENAAYGGAVFGGITNQEASSNSNYHSLQTVVSKRFAHSSLRSAYTLGRCIDTASGLRSTVRYNGQSANRGLCEQDVRHRYVASYVYELPFGRSASGFLGKIIGGWAISGITAFQSGFPFDITETEDRALQGSGDNRPDWNGGKVTFVDPRNVDSSNGGPNRFFNGTGGGTPTAGTNPYFSRVGSGQSVAQGAGRFGTLGRNVFHGPGINNTDISVVKKTSIREEHNLEFRSEFFNIFNHAQFLNPNGSISSANFGRITGTQNPRLIQFALKYNF
jgi:hypothetical protein